MQLMMKNQPGAVLDATTETGLILPVCVKCNTGEAIVREENDTGGSRYRCVVCNIVMPWGDEREKVAQQWADCNNPAVGTN